MNSPLTTSILGGSSLPFDPTAFLDLGVDTSFEKRPPLPAMFDYTATIQEVKARPWQSKEKYDDNGNLKSGIALDIKLVLDLPPEIQAQCNLSKNTFEMEDGVMLDLLPGGGGYDTSPGKNTRLRQYRDALDQNRPGESWTPRKMVGAVLKVRVRHEDYNGSIQERVGALSRA